MMNTHKTSGNYRQFLPEHENITRQLFDKIALYALSFGFLAVASSTIRVFRFGFEVHIIADICTYVSLIALFALRKRLTPMTVAAIFIVLLSINANITFLFTGFITASMVLLCSCCIIAGTIISFRAGSICLFVNSICIGSTAIFFSTGRLKPLYDMNEYITSPYAWFSIITGFIVFSLSSLVIVHFIQDKLRQSIARLKISSDELHASEKKFRLLAETMRDVLLQVDKTLVIQYISPSVNNMFGYTPEEITGSNIDIFSPPKKSAPILAIFSDFLNQSKEHCLNLKPFECELSRKNTSVFPAEFTPSLIGNSDGSLAGIQCIIRDISRQKKAEEEKSLLEKQLRHSEKLEVIGQLAGGIAHDFNNQLSGIMGFAELIKADYPKDSDTYNTASSISSIARRSADLTSKLLAFARKGKYVSEVFDLHVIMSEVTEILSRSIDRSISIITDLDAEYPYVKGDPGQIQNALLNIALNARDAMQDGGTLRFSTKSTIVDEKFKPPYQKNFNPGHYIHLILSDTGTGIDDETKRHLFEPFFTTKEPGKGTGMGLAAVYGTIQAHEGILNVTSRINEGTSFHIYLPVSSKLPQKKEQEKSAEITTGTGSILIIEDEVNVGKMISMVLGRLGYSIEICTNGIEALELYRKRHSEFNAIIVDLIIPGMGGKELIGKFREIDNDIRVLICSGYSANVNVSELLKNNNTLFIQKPFSINDLSSSINRLLTLTSP